jgi:hypothetical protein
MEFRDVYVSTILHLISAQRRPVLDSSTRVPLSNSQSRVKDSN